MSIARKYSGYLGWVGGSISLLAYGLNTHQIISSGSLTFLLMNITGCCCLIYYTFHKQAFANTALNTIHLLITLTAIGGWLLN